MRLDEFITTLYSLFSTDTPIDIKQVKELVQNYALNGDKVWRNYISWSDDKYTRNLIWCCEEFEVLLLCWKPGQDSRVHSHGNSNCWLTVLDGEIEEILYEVYKSVKSTHMQVGQTGFINDKIAVHAIKCNKNQKHGAVTLHVYAPPIRRVKILENGRLAHTCNL